MQRSLIFRITALLMCCALVIMCSPLRVEAVALETLLVGGVFVVASILLGLGVMAGTQTDAWHNVVTNCVDALKSETDWIDADGMIQLVQMSNGVRTSPGCPLDLIEWVRDWLFDNSVIKEVLTNQIVIPQNYRCVSYEAKDWTAALKGDKYDYVFSEGVAFDGTITDTSIMFNTANERYHGGIFFSDLFKLPDGEYQIPPVVGNYYGIDNVLSGAYNFRFGLLRVSDDGSVAVLVSSDKRLTSGEGSLTCPSTVQNFMAKSEYQYCFYYSFVGKASGLDYPSGIEFESRPYIESLEEVETEITVEEGLAVGRVGKFDESISEGYTVWANSATVDGDLTYFPLGIAGDLNAASGMTQEDVWSGVVYAAPPVVNNDDHIGILSYNKGDIPAAMAVHATAPDGGFLKYQWYLDAIPIDGATASVYYPRTDTVGEATYTCLISNYIDVTNDVTAAHVWSLPFVVTISDVAVPDVTTPDVGADTVGDTKLGTFIDALTTPIENAASTVVDGVAALFVPSATAMAAQQVKWGELVTTRFGAMAQAGDLIGDVVDTFHLGDKQEYIEIPGVTVTFGDVPWTFGPFQVKVIPEGFEFVVVSIQWVTNIGCTLLFANALKRRYERIMEG